MKNITNIFQLGADEKRVSTLEHYVEALCRATRTGRGSLLCLGGSIILLACVSMAQIYDIDKLQKEVAQLKGDLKRHQMEGAR